MKKVGLLIGLMVACLLFTTAASASPVFPRYYSGGDSDGGIFRYWWYNGSDNWVELNGSEVGVTYSYGYWAAAVVAMPISQLAGQTLAPNSAKLYFHSSTGLSDVALNRCDFDSGGTVQWGYINGGQTGIATLNSGAGWQCVDITPHLQAQIDAGYNWAGYMFRAGGGGNVSMGESGNCAYIEVVPEPSGLLAMLTGVTGFAGMLFRRRK